ncbi:MAG: GGDEF and EAL domain-containing protein [Alphaproteobacteria bacterium]|nr:GGDEF and EAL domain-containing protein [Alphaproteobacteria bacterium]
MTRYLLAALAAFVLATFAAAAAAPQQQQQQQKKVQATPAAQATQAVPAAQAAQAAPAAVDLGISDPVMELQDALGPYKMPASVQPKSSSWYSFSATNNSARPAIRILQAGQSSSIALDVFPHSTRPAIISLASPDPGAIVEPAKAYGGRSYRVTILPKTTVSLAVEIANAETPPSLLAWTEPALASHNRQIAIFIAAVAGLIFAAAAIAGGLAVMTGHKPPLWAAITLTLVLLARLAGTGMFDASLATHVGGPYGLTALFAGLALAAGMRLADTIVPVEGAWPWAVRWFHWGVIAIGILAILAYLGVPTATVLIDVLVVFGSAAITVYLVHRGRYGSQTARVIAPSSAVFALVTLAAMVTSLGGLGNTTMAPDIAGGFAAAGAVLLALAVAAGEGIAMLPVPHRIAQIPTTALAAIGASHQGIFDLEFDTDEVVLSREAASLLGLSEAESRMPHKAWTARVHPDDREVYQHALGDYREQAGLAFRIEFRVRDEAGRYPWFELRATMMGSRSAANRCLGLIADITLRKEAESAVASQSLRDALTGLGNRTALNERLTGLGDGFLDATLAVLDIDRFKSIHASLGDAGADALLVQVGQRLAAELAEGVEIYRFGGDAFAVLLHRPDGSAQTLGTELVKLCGRAYTQDGRQVFAAVSCGVTVGHDARDAADLVRNAELALSQAKQDGGGCARVYARAMGAQPQGDAVALEAELRQAIENGELEVFYQPIVRLADGAVAGFEALLRWRHPERGLIAPSEFIAHSEATGLIVTLGRFALESAAHDLVQWQRFFPLDPPLFVSVNVSQRQLRDAGFETFLKQLMEICPVAAGTLKLEVTESAAVAGSQSALRRIRALGASLAIDDFGTGQSSLSRFKDLPFDTVKIDRSFLSRHGGTHSESDSAVVLGSIVTLAHDLKREVVVEGVENEDDARHVAGLGCEYAQGFFYSPPLPLADALNYIARHYNPSTAAKS